MEEIPLQWVFVNEKKKNIKRLIANSSGEYESPILNKIGGK